MYKKFSGTKQLTLSGLVIALYVVIMYFTQSFAFGTVQIRIATCFYALGYFYPFLIVPLGVANLISNFTMGGLGIWDVIGGAAVGMITTGGVFLLRKFKLPKWWMIAVIVAGPGLLVPLWLAPLTNTPYPVVAAGVCTGQILPAIAGYFLITALTRFGDDK